MTATTTPATITPTMPAPTTPVDRWPDGTTILGMLAERTANADGRVALRARDQNGKWQAITWAAYGHVIEEVAAGLQTLGVVPGERVGILSWNRPEWQEADLGILSIGAVSVPVYPTSASPQVGYVLKHSGARVCFVEDAEQLARVLEQRHELKKLSHIVVFGESQVAIDDKTLLSFSELCALGRDALERDPEAVSVATAAVSPDDVATLVYTSGTTGPPKGAIVTHGNLMATLRSVTKIIPLSTDDRFLSFLPLSHITERSVSHFGLIAPGGETWFARSISTVAEDLPDCRPTIFFAVPRVWEKMREGIEDKVAQLDGVPGRLGRSYLSLATARARELEVQDYMPFHTKVEWLALDKLVGAKLRAQLGLDAARFLVSGAAPIHPDLVRWFMGVGLPIAEGYGQTEVALATTLNPPGAARVGTVGPPLPGEQVRIADDGEILVKGDNVCRGYWHNDEGTRELLDPEGWLHSGDLGAFDDHGYLKITGRKKDLIITAHGKNISPQNIESELASHSLIGQAVVVGDARKYLTALIALDDAAAARWASVHNKGAVGLESLTRDRDLIDEIESIVAEVNAGHAHVEQIRKWRVLPRALTVDGGELTPTLKVRRAAVNERYADLITDMYAEPNPTATAGE
jgi:long-chain acyl-CoA synthetase